MDVGPVKKHGRLTKDEFHNWRQALVIMQTPLYAQHLSVIQFHKLYKLAVYPPVTSDLRDHSKQPESWILHALLFCIFRPALRKKTWDWTSFCGMICPNCLQLLFTQPSIFKRSFRSICAACHAPPGQTKQQRRVTSDVPMVLKWYTYQTMHLEWCHEPPRHFTFYDSFSSLKLCSAAIFIKDFLDVQMTATN